jgi:hypothetical protein
LDKYLVVVVVVVADKDVDLVVGLPMDLVGSVNARTAGIKHRIRCRYLVITSSALNAEL